MATSRTLAFGAPRDLPSLVAGMLVAAMVASPIAAAQSAGAGGLRGAAEPAPSADAPATLDATLDAMLSTWCLDCHSGPRAKGHLDLASGGALDNDRSRRSVLRSMHARLVAREMPPEPPFPDEATYGTAIQAIDTILASLPAPDPSAFGPGRVTMRRLSRTEYGNTVRDLLGVAFDATAFFPADEIGDGFDNSGDVLSMTPLLLEQCMDAAERLATLAVADLSGGEPHVRRLRGEELSAEGGGAPYGEGWSLFSNGSIGATVALPRPGRYRIRAEVAGQQAGNEPVRMQLRLGKRVLETFNVRGQRTLEVIEAETTVEKAGEHAVAAAFVNDYYRKDDPDPEDRDRNAFVQWLEVVGPLDSAEPTALQRDLAARFDPLPPDKRLRAYVGHVAGRAWRRPLAEDELENLLAAARSAAGSDAPDWRVLRAAVTTILVHPRFLFRVEEDPAAGSPVRDLDDWELASRLSYFLWARMPDDALFAAASRGELSIAEGRAAQVERMLADPRSLALAEHVATQWLAVRSLSTRSPDPQRFPDANAELIEAMRLETVLFFDSVLREDRPVWDLLRADDTFLNEALAKHYGVRGVRGPQMRRVSLAALADPTEGLGATGILRHGSILLATSNPTRTSPVKRGKWVLESLLDDPPPPAPPGVPPLAAADGSREHRSVRELLEAHRVDPACASCHRRMDPLGFALEPFDAVGRWRKTDGDRPVDAAGELPDGTRIDGPLGLRDYLMGSDRFLRSLARHLATYALGRGLDSDDEIAIDEVVEGWGGEPTLRSLVHAIVELPAFRQRAAAR